MTITLSLSASNQQFIAGRRVAGDEATLLSQCAADGKLTRYHFYLASREEAAAAAEAADQALPVYSQTTPDMRARFLDTIADKLGLLSEGFSVIAHQETALPLTRLQGERTRASSQLRMLAGVLRRGDAFGIRTGTALPGRQLLPRPDLHQLLTAFGPVTAFGTNNFPLVFSTTGGDTTPALAAGCSVVVEAHPGHMATAELTTQAIVRAVVTPGLPAGIFSMIFGTDIDADLVRHPVIQAVGFISSLHGGKAPWQLAQ